jgi:hypothetical protein
MQQTAMTNTPEPVDTTARYDVYCAERNQIVVYRNVLFKGVKTLFQRNENDPSGDFIELEHRDSQTVFVPKSLIVRFCLAGVKPGAVEA